MSPVEDYKVPTVIDYLESLAGGDSMIAVLDSLQAIGNPSAVRLRHADEKHA